MAAPSSAKPLPFQTPNSSSPMVEIDAAGLIEAIRAQSAATLEDSLTSGSIAVEAANPKLLGYVTIAWRYVFSQFALTTALVNPDFAQTISASPTQAEVQALSDQVSLQSRQIGRMP